MCEDHTVDAYSMVLLMKVMMEFASFVVLLICLFQDTFAVIVTPRYVAKLLCSVFSYVWCRTT